MSFRGVQKKVIALRPDSDLFEEAYFVIRDREDALTQPGDMVREANRVLRESLVSRATPRRGRGGRGIVPFLFGMGFAAALLIPLFLWVL